LDKNIFKSKQEPWGTDNLDSSKIRRQGAVESVEDKSRIKD
jgi:hypothetical protein